MDLYPDCEIKTEQFYLYKCLWFKSKLHLGCDTWYNAWFEKQTINF